MSKDSTMQTKYPAVNVTIQFCLLLALLPGTSCDLAAPDEDTVGDDRWLRTIVDEKYADGSIIVGATTNAWAFGAETGAILDREFSYVTPGNDFKQWNIHPNNMSTWNWRETDAWAAHIIQNNQILRMHCPISPQCSDWAKADDRTGAELERNMRSFVRAVCERYNNAPGFEYMDVVNETVNGGGWFTDRPGNGWEVPWYKIGQDTDKNATPLYIRYAFEIAQQYAPNIKLIYNQYDGPEISASWELIKETIYYLRALGLRVDGIGWQAHVDNGWATAEHLDDLRELIDWAHSNDLEFHITEAGVWLKNGISEELLEEQAYTYRAILEVLLEKRATGKVGWNTWHIDDGHGWEIRYYPSLFDADYEAKPAYYAIRDALDSADPATDQSAVPQFQSIQ
jgi:GH35 family endo-1,4-beta-xylanase